MMALEEAFQVTVDESAFSSAGTISDLETLVASPEFASTDHAAAIPSHEPRASDRPSDIAFPSWNRAWPVRAIRRASLPTWILPLGRVFARVTVTGVEHFEHIDGPVIFAANHQSHFDTPVIYDSLPARWRYRVSTAMAKQFFDAHFFPERFTSRQWFTNSLNYYLAAFFFNAFPLPQGGAGTRQTLRYMGEIVEDGFSILIYPEGRRTEEGEIGPFQPGVAMIAARLGVPVVPVRVRGLDQILQRHMRWPSIGRAHVAFGAPISLTGNDYATMAKQVEEAVRSL